MATPLRITMQSVPGKPNHRELFLPLPCIDEDGEFNVIPQGFIWNGSSVPFGFNAMFPRHRHPIASCRHDWRCSRAKNKAERKFADKQFEKDVGKTSWWVTKKAGYLGVRIGALFGIGNSF